MGAAATAHPSDQTLSAYGLGKLDDHTANSVHAHLEACEYCRKRVSGMSSDSFLDRVRDARGTGESQTYGTQDYQGSSFTPRPPADTLPPGLADHPDYVIKKELGRGGMGVVYLAHNALMGRDEVLKVMSRQIIEKPGVLDRFLREIRAVAKLRHMNIVTAYSAVRLGESIVFAMEYVDGLDLSKMVKAKGPLPVAHACNFVYQSALGLQHAHEEGLVHRDIKPGNLMLARKGDKATVKVLDFGLAKATREEKVDGGLTSVGQALGTPDFIAPEQILDAQSADIRADIYSLGGTLYYLLTGRPPFKANSLYDIYQAHISRDADPLNFVRPEVPSELAALVAKMMAKDSRRRFQTPGEVAEALTPFFKKGNAPLKPVKRLEPVALPSTQPVASVPPAAVTEGTEPAWGKLIDTKAPAPVAEQPAPVAVDAAAPPRPRWPIVAAACAGLFAILLGIIIYVRRDEKKTIGAIGSPEDLNKAGVTPGAPKAAPSAPGASSIPRIPVVGKTDQGQFTIVKGHSQWSRDGDELSVSRVGANLPLVLFGDYLWTDYDFTVDALRTNGDHGFVLHVRDTSETGMNGFNCWYLGAGEECRFNERSGLEEKVLRSFPHKLTSNRWYTARVRVRGSRFQCFLKDGDQEITIFDLDDKRHPNGRVGLQSAWSAWRFKNIKVTDPDGNVLWEGPPRLATEASELEKLQGTWGVVAYNGAAPTNDPAKTWTTVVTGSHYVARHGDEIVAEGTLTLDPTKSPRWLELKPTKGVNAGNIALGIYDWRGEDWLIKHSNDQRPTDFSLGAQGKAGGLFLMRRMEGVSIPAVKVANDPTPGFVSLFNGKNLTGWSGDIGDYEIRDGLLSCMPGKKAVIYEPVVRRDFVARAEFRLAPGAESGMLIHYIGVGRGSSAGMCEIQILDDYHPSYAKIDSRCYNGSAWGMAAAKTGFLKNDGEWNVQQVTVRGSTVKVELNGVVILDTDLAPHLDTLNVKTNPGKDRRSGYFGVQSGPGTNQGNVQFRKIEIKELEGTPAVPVSSIATTAAPVPPIKRLEGAFVPLFNGKNLSGWEGLREKTIDPGEIAEVRNGEVFLKKDWNLSYLRTKKIYHDFIFRLEYLVGAGWKVNDPFSGVTIQAERPGGLTANDSIDVRVIRRASGDFFMNGSLRLAGSAPGTGWRPVAHKLIADRPGGEWNQLVVRCEGSKITCELNGKIVNEARASEPIAGRIGLVNGGLTVRFRKIEIKELGGTSVPPSATGAAPVRDVTPAEEGRLLGRNAGSVRPAKLRIE
jgi:uncharacterized protein (TIGR03067 family)